MVIALGRRPKLRPHFKMRSRSQGLLETCAARYVGAMTTTTETDNFVLAQANPVLRPGEAIATWAYLMPPISTGGSRIGGAVRAFANAATKSAAFAVVTNQRLLLFQTRIGAFKPLLENHGLQSFERSLIRGASVGSTLLIELTDGQMIEYQVKRSTSHVSTQASFFAQLESLLGRSEAAHKLGASKNRANQIATAIATAIAIGYVAFKFLVH